MKASIQSVGSDLVAGLKGATQLGNTQPQRELEVRLIQNGLPIAAPFHRGGQTKLGSLRVFGAVAQIAARGGKNTDVPGDTEIVVAVAPRALVTTEP